MKIYHYDPSTHELLSEGQARPNPREKDKFLIPGFATDKKPPSTSANEAAVFNKDLDDWEVKPDYRNEKYFFKENGLDVVLEVGYAPDDTMTAIAPPVLKAFEKASFVDGQWVVESTREALPRDLLEEIIDGFNGDVPFSEAQQLVSNADLSLGVLLPLLVAKSPLTEEEYEGIKAQLSDIAITKLGLPEATVNEVVGKVETNFKGKVKFKDGKGKSEKQ